MNMLAKRRNEKAKCIAETRDHDPRTQRRIKVQRSPRGKIIAQNHFATPLTGCSFQYYRRSDTSSVKGLTYFGEATAIGIYLTNSACFLRRVHALRHCFYRLQYSGS